MYVLIYQCCSKCDVFKTVTLRQNRYFLQFPLHYPMNDGWFSDETLYKSQPKLYQPCLYKILPRVVGYTGSYNHFRFTETWLCIFGGQKTPTIMRFMHSTSNKMCFSVSNVHLKIIRVICYRFLDRTSISGFKQLKHHLFKTVYCISKLQIVPYFVLF